MSQPGIMDPYEVKQAPAKINWVLEVLGKRADGYHEIDTLMQTISLADELKLKPIKGDQPRLICSDPTLPLNEENLVWRAWAAIRQTFPQRVPAYEISIRKTIPHGAGLGGGSSDAAATLHIMNRFLTFNKTTEILMPLGQVKGYPSDPDALIQAVVDRIVNPPMEIPLERLAEIAGGIGSDPPFFIYEGLARARGRGEIIQPLRPPAQPIHLVVVFPGFGSPTAAAYRSLNAAPFDPSLPGTNRVEAALFALESSDPEAIAGAVYNDFDIALSRVEPRYDEMRARMKSAGLLAPTLSGSGSAMFGIARSEAAAARAAEELSAHYPFARAAHTLTVAPDAPSCAG